MHTGGGLRPEYLRATDKVICWVGVSRDQVSLVELRDSCASLVTWPSLRISSDRAFYAEVIAKPHRCFQPFSSHWKFSPTGTSIMFIILKAVILAITFSASGCSIHVTSLLDFKFEIIPRLTSTNTYSKFNNAWRLWYSEICIFKSKLTRWPCKSRTRLRLKAYCKSFDIYSFYSFVLEKSENCMNRTFLFAIPICITESNFYATGLNILNSC